MNVYRRFAFVASSVLCCMFASFQAFAAIPRDVVGMQDEYRRSYLHVDGPRLVTASGQEVSLHGINVGGWLVTEDWMCGFTDSQDVAAPGGGSGRSALESLEDRFGARKAAALMDAWQDHWITSRDLDQIRDAGFNLIRVPIGYRTLQHADGSWIVDAHGQIDFSRMDWIVREAAKRGVYSIFDLHVWPEQRLAYDKIGRPEGQAIRDAMAGLWTAIATHYRGNGAIAAFDLINEFPGNWGVQEVLFRAVRDGDPNRVQVIEGFTFQEFVKLHAAGQFPNSVFSDHFYKAEPHASEPLSTEEIKARLMEMRDSPAPVYIGEFLAADFVSATAAMNASRVAWSSWTYKTVDMGQWGLVNYTSNLKIDVQNDSFSDILAKWSSDLTAWQAPGAASTVSINDNRRFAAMTALGVPLQ